MSVFIFPYNVASESVKALKQNLQIKSIKKENSKFKAGPKRVVINWGCSKIPDEVQKCQILNQPQAVEKAVNKLTAFNTFKQEEVSIPEFTTDKSVALEWLNQGKIVVVRSVVNGYGGDGILLVENQMELPDAPLYTQYIPKSEEYRVHVIKNEAFFIQRKARKKEIPDDKINWKIRNLAGGFIFANQDVQVEDRCKELACKAIQSVGLDFGAVDIIFNKTRNQYYVLEINTAPGLSGTTLEKYTQQFERFK